MSSLIAPFKDQLTHYEQELQQQKEGKVASDEQVKELQEKYAGILGHQNNKQKIKHIMNLKKEITALKEVIEYEYLKHLCL